MKWITAFAAKQQLVPSVWDFFTSCARRLLGFVAQNYGSVLVSYYCTPRLFPSAAKFYVTSFSSVPTFLPSLKIRCLHLPTFEPFSSIFSTSLLSLFFSFRSFYSFLSMLRFHSISSNIFRLPTICPRTTCRMWKFLSSAITFDEYISQSLWNAIKTVSVTRSGSNR